MPAPDPHALWIEKHFGFSVRLFRDRDPYKLDEVVARMRDLTMARNTYAEAIARWPGRPVMLRQGGRILKRSDRPA